MDIERNLKITALKLKLKYIELEIAYYKYEIDVLIKYHGSIDDIENYQRILKICEVSHQKILTDLNSIWL